MPDAGHALRAYRSRAIAGVEQFLSSRGVAYRRLQGDEVTGTGIANGKTAWETRLVVDGREYDVRLAADAMFPFSRPVITVKDKGLFLKYPHVDSKGMLCLIPLHWGHKVSTDADLLGYMLSEAQALLRDGASGANRKDFVDEFLSYWCPTSAGNVLCLLDPIPPSRSVSLWSGKGCTLVTEDGGVGEVWMSRFLGETGKDGRERSPSAFIWLAQPLLPDDYPATNTNVAALAKKAGDEASAVLVEAIRDVPASRPVILGFATENGPALAAVRLHSPSQSDMQGKHRRSVAADGFRKSTTLPAEIAASRYFGGHTKVTKLAAQRVDPQWVHSRGGAGQAHLLEKSVCIVGCGSVGAMVAHLLAQAGVGTFTLIDPDPMSWDNVGRHLLGGNDLIGKPKADALKERLGRHLPHIYVDSMGDRKWQDVYGDDPTEVTTCDVIVSMTGSWEAESAINYANRTERFPPVVFGWTEEHACAGHSLLVAGQGGCLTCGMTETGGFAMKVTEWPAGNALEREPACGGFYQPYGSAALAAIQSMIATHVLEFLAGTTTDSELRTWVGSPAHISSCGGNLAPNYSWVSDDKACLGRVLTRAWLPAERCNLCKGVSPR